MSDLAAIASTELLDDSRTPVRIGALWEERPVAIVFLRHFGCIFCREHAAELNERLDEIREAGGDVAAIGLGEPEHAADFRRLSGIRFPLLVSPDTAVHEAAGLTRGDWLRVIGPQNLGRGVQAALKGHRTKRTGADMSQLGGTFVVDTDGAVLYEHRASKAADNAPVDEIVAAFEPARAPA